MTIEILQRRKTTNVTIHCKRRRVNTKRRQQQKTQNYNRFSDSSLVGHLARGLMRTKAAPRLFPFFCLLVPPPSSPFPLRAFPQLLPHILVEPWSYWPWVMPWFFSSSSGDGDFLTPFPSQDVPPEKGPSLGLSKLNARRSNSQSSCLQNCNGVGNAPETKKNDRGCVWGVGCG